MPMIITDPNLPDNPIVFANTAFSRLTGYGNDELLGRNCRFLQGPGTDPASVAMIKEAIQQRTPFEIELVNYTKDHKEFWNRLLVAPVFNECGRLIYFFGSQYDNTAAQVAHQALLQKSNEIKALNDTLELRVAETLNERLKIEDQLHQSQKMEVVGQLTGGVAHDFNNLLTVIRGSADLLRRENLSEELRTRHIDAIIATADRATKLTNQLLAFSRQQALRPEIFDAVESLRVVRDMLKTLIGSGITITLDLREEPCFVNADRSQFDTAIINMALNARDAMNAKGDLNIKVDTVPVMPGIRGHSYVEGPFATITISDTGSGISVDKLSKVFEPFFTTKGVGQGTGLGLSQVFGFAQQSGGNIHVASVEGEGSTFTMYLPLVPAPCEPQSDEDESLLPITGKGARILVVEDNLEVGEFATVALAELGYETALALDATKALAELAANEGSFDVVFTDVVMPGMSGVEMGEQIKRIYPGLPVILTSGYSDVLAQNGALGFELLRKPYSIEELSQILCKVANRRSAGFRA